MLATHPGISAWVMANAGAGKTSLLVSRVLRLLLEGVEPERILCITYTNAGAAEMEHRITGELSKWAVAEDDALHASLQKLMGYAPANAVRQKARALFAHVADAPERLRILTIHSFCQSLLRRFPLEAEVSPHFTLIDDNTSRELLQEVIQRIYIHSLDDENAKLARAVRALSLSGSENSFHEMMRDLIGERRRLRALLEEDDTDARIARLHAMLGIPCGLDEDTLFRQSFDYREGELAELRAVTAALSQSSKADDARTFSALQAWLSAPSRNMENAAPYVDSYFTKEGTLRSRISNKNTLPETLQSALDREVLRISEFEERRRALAIARASAHLLTVTSAIFAHYESLKSARAMLDYDDLILRATRLLTRPDGSQWVMYKLEGGIDHVLLDEAQDTSGEQWDIVKALTEEFFAGLGRSERDRTLFVVGDVKQSIFSFQGAEPRAFGKMQAYFKQKADDAVLHLESIPLLESFRSAAPVLQAVDAVFAQDEAALRMGEEAVSVSHALMREGIAGRVEWWPLVDAEAEPDEQKSKKPGWQLPLSYLPEGRSSHALADYLTDMIAGWLRDGEMLESEGRRIEPGDIMVLVQRRSDFVEALTRSLKRAHVPVAGADRMRLMENLAVLDLTALGAFLLLPEDDLSLACLMKSPLLGLSEEDLLALAAGRGAQSLWQRLRASRAVAPRFETACGWLEEMLSLTDQLPPFELFSHALEKRGGRERIAGRLGAEYHEALDEFLQQTLIYERSHTPSLQGFLHWLEQGEMEIKRDMEQGRNEVRILTVHGAKGLEAPIVILPDTMGSPPAGKSLFFVPIEGEIQLLWVPTRNGHKQDCALTACIREARKEAQREESLRLFYVALTRPRDRLYICGWKPAKPPKFNWHGLAGAALEAIGECVETPAGTGWRVSSSQTEPPKTRIRMAADSSPLPLPPCFDHSLPEEPAARIFSPSHLEEAEVVFPSPLHEKGIFQRGVTIHRLLQYLPSIAPARRREAALDWLARFAEQDIRPEARTALVDDVLKVIGQPQLAALFGEDSRAEVPLVGTVMLQGKPVVIAGQVDRLAVDGNRVLIADYKSHHRAPARPEDAPAAYIRQLAAYRALIRRIYPEKEILCALVWTAAPGWMIIPPGMLDHAFLA